MVCLLFIYVVSSHVLWSKFFFYRESVSSRSPHPSNERFDQINRFSRENKPKVVNQVYCVKKNCVLNKNSDLAQDNEKPTISEVSANSSSVDLPNDEHVSNIKAEQTSSLARGQDKTKPKGSAQAGQSGSQHRTIRIGVLGGLPTLEQH